MASGKSALGEKLARKLKYKFIDLDCYIEKKENLSVTQIFNSKGELYFRKLENASLKEIVEKEKNYILSLGGGTPCFYDTMDWLQAIANVKTIYIKVDLDTLVQRLLKGKSHRPLISHLKEEEDVRVFVAKHLFERSYFYNKADLNIEGSNEVDVIIENLLFKLF